MFFKKKTVSKSYYRNTKAWKKKHKPQRDYAKYVYNFLFYLLMLLIAVMTVATLIGAIIAVAGNKDLPDTVIGIDLICPVISVFLIIAIVAIKNYRKKKGRDTSDWDG